MDDLKEQQFWVDSCAAIVRKFDPQMQIPMQFHVRAGDYRGGNHVPEVIRRFLNIINQFPDSAVVVWHCFSYGYAILSDYLSGGRNRYVTFGRRSTYYRYLKVCFFD